MEFSVFLVGEEEEKKKRKGRREDPKQKDTRRAWDGGTIVRVTGEVGKLSADQSAAHQLSLRALGCQTFTAYHKARRWSPHPELRRASDTNKTPGMLAQ